MSELRRWSEEGATAAERELLEASRAERPPPHARVRALHAVGITTAVATVTATTAASAASTTATVSTAAATTAMTAGWVLAAKIVGVSVLAGGVVAGGLAVRAFHRTGAPATTGRQVTAQAEPPAEPPLPAPDPSVTDLGVSPSASAPPPPATPRARTRRSPGPSDRLSQEVAALERAHRALAAHDPEAALRLLDGYRADFPGGALASDATVLRVQALLAKGDRAAAQTLADAYSADHPESPYGKRIEDLVRTERKK